ncbi:MAG: hypothetical protein ACREHD_01710, partial [Pirellulales bacterium]
EALAAPGDSDEETRRRAAQVLADMQMLANLEDARVRSTQTEAGFDLTDEDGSYAQAFREYGIDIDALDRDDAVLRIRARPIRYELSVLLDSWSYVRRRLATQGAMPAGKDWKELLEVARAADPDPWRDRFRKAVLNDNRQALVELAASAPLSSLRVETVDRLGDALLGMGAIDDAAAFLKKGQRLYPQDYWINTNLGLCLLRARPPQPEHAIRYFTAAVALRPEAALSHANLAVALAKHGELDATRDALTMAAALRGGAAPERNGPQTKPPGTGRASDYVCLSQWDKAAAEFAKTVWSRPLRDDAFAYACLLLIREDSEGYQRFCQETIEPAAETKDPWEAFVLARACAMARESPLDPARAIRWAKLAVAIDRHPWNFHVLGLAEYRAGELDQALQSFTKANVDAWNYKELNWFGLALVYHGLGQLDEARRCFDKGIQWLELQGAPGPDQPAKLLPPDWLEAQLLRREAEDLLEIKRSP